MHLVGSKYTRTCLLAWFTNWCRKRSLTTGICYWIPLVRMGLWTLQGDDRHSKRLHKHHCRVAFSNIGTQCGISVFPLGLHQRLRAAKEHSHPTLMAVPLLRATPPIEALRHQPANLLLAGEAVHFFLSRMTPALTILVCFLTGTQSDFLRMALP